MARLAGFIARHMDTGALERHGAHAVVLATGGFGKIYYLEEKQLVEPTYGKGDNVFLDP